MNKIKTRLRIIRKGVSKKDRFAIAKFFLMRKKIENLNVRVSDKSFLNVRKNKPNDLWMALPEMDEKLFDHIKLKKYGVILDIGANIGRHSLIFSEIPHSKVFSFEPQKDNFTALGKNIRINNRTNITPFNIGIFDENKKIVLNICDSNCGANSIVIERGGKQEEISVERLDDFLKKRKIGKVDFIKIDVEGAEINVLDGAKKTIEEFKPDIFLEILKDKDKIFSYLTEKGYEIKYFGDSNYFATIK